MKRTFIRILAVVFVVFFVLSVCTISAIYSSNKPLARNIKETIKYYLYKDKRKFPSYDSHINLENMEKKVLYVNNQPQMHLNFLPNEDNKLIEYAKDKMRIIDFARGYYLDLPEELSPDFSQSPNFSKFNSEFMDVVISKEWSQTDDVDGYIAYYLNRFITNQEYRKNNNVTLMEDATKQFGQNSVRIISVRIEDMPADKKNVYTYATINIGNREFYRLMFKFKSDYKLINEVTEEALTTFTQIKKEGILRYDMEYHFKMPKIWSDVTKDKFKSIHKSNKIQWGIFTPQVQEDGINRKIPELEEKLDFKFPVVLIYNHIGQPLSQNFIDKCEQEGRMIELTLQMTETNNEDLLCKSPLLETYKGKYDDKIRALAKQLKKIKSPFFFRLNNEMNSDWANYSGIINLSDPDIYAESWRRVYQIFEEESVNNAIWVFNPNDRDYPPCNWNHFLAYFPGEEYVHMIGVTGYNTGNYYKKETGEDWREFKDIYEEVNLAYSPFFKNYPWIITEFASSSYGGDKVKWIESMFRDIKHYPQIKVAVWFSAADIDTRKGREGTPARPYMLDETPQTLDAFHKGIRE